MLNGVGHVVACLLVRIIGFASCILLFTRLFMFTFLRGKTHHVNQASKSPSQRPYTHITSCLPELKPKNVYNMEDATVFEVIFRSNFFRIFWEGNHRF